MAPSASCFHDSSLRPVPYPLQANSLASYGHFSDIFGHARLFVPEKMFEPKLSQARLGFITSSPSHRRQFSINRDRGLPVVSLLEQMCRIESRLVEPEKFMLQLRSRTFFNHAVVSR